MHQVNTFSSALGRAVFGNKAHLPAGPKGGQFAPKGQGIEVGGDDPPELKGKLKGFKTDIETMIYRAEINRIQNLLPRLRKLSIEDRTALGKHFGVQDGDKMKIFANLCQKIRGSYAEYRSSGRIRYPTTKDEARIKACRGTGVSSDNWKPPSKPWANSKTIEAATKQLSKAFPHVTFDLKGLDLGIVNQMMPHFYRMTTEFPETAKHLRYLGTFRTPTADIPKTEMFRSGNRLSLAQADVDGKGLYLNPAVLGHPEKLSTMLSEHQATGYNPWGCGKPEYVLIHEFGHLVAASLDRAKPDMKSWLRKNHYSSALSSQISTYAHKDEGESFAESFAIHQMRDQPTWPTYTKNQDALLKQFKGQL